MTIQEKLWLRISGTIITGLITAGALFTTLFGETVTLKIIASLGIINIIVGTISSTLTTDASAVSDASNVTGVEPIQINEKASKAIATMAVDQNIKNITAATDAIEAVQAKASS